MVSFRPYDRCQQLLLPPDLREWVPEDDLAHFVIEAVERVRIEAFQVNWRGTGKAQYHPRMMLALLIYCYANGIFSSRRIERATHRDVGVRFVAADQHPDHDTIASFRRGNAAAIAAAFAEVLELARELGLVKLGMVAIDGTKLDANASKHRSIRYDRAVALRAELARDIAELLARAEAADAAEDTTAPDLGTLPAEIARRQALKEKLDEVCARLEADARAVAEAEQPAYEEKKRRHEARNGQGRPPRPPDDTPPPAAQSNLSDPDSALMRKSKRHEYRQAYNAQAVVDADGPQLVLAAGVSGNPSDAPTFEAMIDELCTTVGQPATVLADTGFAQEAAVRAIEARGIEALVAIGRPEGERRYDFRPPKPDAKPPPAIKAPWRLEMKAKLETDEAKEKYKRRKCSVEPVFGVIRNVLGFTHFHLRGIENVLNEWILVTMAYNCKRITSIMAT